MLKLYHLAISPFSRSIRLVCAEKKLELDLVDEFPWEKRTDFLALNPAGKIPVLRDKDTVIAETSAIFEYLEEKHPTPPLLPKSPSARAEARRLQSYFNDRFYHDVTKKILFERVYRKIARDGYPDNLEISAALKAIKFHYGYMEFLLEERRWLAGSELSIADFTAAAHLSALDYLGDVNWHIIPNVKDWYAKIKSRPAFRPLLQDLMQGVRPAPHYADLDF